VPDSSQTSLLPEEAAANPVRERMYVGTCSWAEKSFVKSDFYPRAIRRAEDRLRYYATQFPTVEIDASYFALLPPAYSRRWAEDTPPGFIMHAKAFGLFTGHGTSVERLPKGFASLLPPTVRDAKEIRVADVPEEFLNACWDHFRGFLAPLADAGKLGYVLFKLPPSAMYSPETLEAMRGWKRELAGCRLAIEFRNRDWSRHPEAMEFLEKEGLIYVMVDLPDVPRLMPVLEAVTGEWAVVRFHGRNRAGWERAGASTEQRYDYEYSVDELRPWAGAAERLTGRASRFFAMFNNHVRGNMARNGRTFVNLLKGAPAAGESRDA
jgi:uncharacterized protein YecE (DUF72 family)